MDFKSTRFPSLMSAIRLNIPMAPTTTTKSLSLFFFLLLSHALLSAKAQQRRIDGCASFSCGQFQNISYPFRRRDDPPQCGETSYQLNCQGNKSTISIRSVEYLVTSIDDYSFRLVDPKFVSGGSCGLPSQSLSPSTLHNLGYTSNSSWASFMNCSKAPEKNEGMYWPFSCPTRYNNTFLYVVIAEDGFKLKYLLPPCQFISMIPVTVVAYKQSLSLNSAADVLSILQHGFQLLVFDGRRTNITSFSQNITLSSQRNQQTIVQWLNVILVVLSRLPVSLLIWFIVLYKIWSIRRQILKDTVEKFLRRQEMLTPTRYPYTSIIAITGHFREKLGQGGFGSVFKGEFAGGVHVAVKMMGSSKCNGEEFISEVSTIGRIHHVNVVRLVGYCSEGSKRALIYEYMPNGSLDKYLFSKKNTTNLHTFTSEKLYDIAIGIARGIDYLHRGCDMQILHFDIKPHNILLDHNFTPKISDFGLARLYPKDNSLVSISAIRGTIGYIAPELISRSFGIISQKSDVYSYGMLLLEMAGRRRNVDPLVGNSSQVYYPSWIYDKLNQQQDITLDISFEINELEKKLAIVGLWCIQMKSFDRPTMIEVIEMLESDVEMIPMPPKPFLSSMDSISENKTCLVSSSAELSVVLE